MIKDRAYVGHAALAVLAIILTAAAAWWPSANRDDSDVILVPGEPERLTAVEWRESLYDVRLFRPGEEQVRVTVTKYPRARQGVGLSEDSTPGDAATEGDADADAVGAAPAGDGPDTPGGETDGPGDATAEAAPEVPPTIKTYPGSKKAQELFEELAPLKAARRLGALEETKLPSLGLDVPSAALVLRYNGDAHEIQIGSATYGSGDRYARLSNGEVYLLKAVTISGLRNGATTMLDRRALPVETERIRRATITVGPRGREVIHRFAEDPKKAFFADPAVPDEQLEQVSNWLDRVFKLRIADVVEEDPVGPSSLELELFNGNETLGRLEIWEPTDRVALARSTAFDATISLSKANAEAILRDLEGVLTEGR